ncbi:MAG: hypothetical protein KatS3mg061_1242 [Dehalococcoidia bacterium]|nr:MAG: hypothetical protein KatS3mg061_1242 [Dehalococcoidia bacterium]
MNRRAATLLGLGGLLAVMLAVGVVLLPAARGSGAASRPRQPQPPAWLASRQEPYAQVEVGGTVVWARLALTPEQRTQGLSGVERLEPDEGMLFVYPVKGRYPFWMRGMLFPLDMLWIDDDRVVDLKPDRPVPAPGQSESELPIYSPLADANYVLEVNAGWAAAHGIIVGSPVTITLPTGIALPR